MAGIMRRMTDAIGYHDALADGWDERYRRGGFARRARFFVRDILPILPSGGLWLDAGCGSGTFSRLLANDGRLVTGADASRKMLEEAAARARKDEERISFCSIETLENLPFPAANFDGVLCLSVLEYVAHPAEALSEMARVLKPGGTLVLSVPHRLSVLRAAQKIYRSLRRPKKSGDLDYLAVSRFSVSPDELKAELARNGMTIRTQLGFDPIIPRALYALLIPSLIYLICEKQMGDAP